MSLAVRITDLATRVASELKAHKTLINGNAADLSSLTTSNKGHLVAAINEVNAKPSGGSPGAATELVAGVVELATAAEATAGADTTRAVTPAGVQAVRTALKSEILGAGVPAALDTLDELAAALADDANFAATTTTALGNRLRIDTAAQGLTTTQQGNGRTNLSVYSKAEIGDPETDFVATFNAGLI